MKNDSPWPEWTIRAHANRKPNFETRTCSPDDWGYRSNHHPQQVVIMAAGWPAKLLTWLFRIKPCTYTGTNEPYWPIPSLMKRK